MKKYLVHYVIDGKRMSKEIKAKDREDAIRKIEKMHSWFSKPNIEIKYVLEV